MYDGVLRLRLSGRTKDGIALVIVANSDREAGSLDNAYICTKEHTTKRRPSRKLVEPATIRVGSITVLSARTIRYLGVFMFDTWLSFTEHLAEANRKAARVTGALARINYSFSLSAGRQHCTQPRYWPKRPRKAPVFRFLDDIGRRSLSHS